MAWGLGWGWDLCFHFGKIEGRREGWGSRGEGEDVGTGDRGEVDVCFVW